MITNIEESWYNLLKQEFNKNYYSELVEFVTNEYQTETVFPPVDKIFSAFNLCPLNSVKVVILGQDPYHNYNQANGLSFSVNDGVKLPPSLVNIYKEIESDLGIKTSKNGNLERWANQGVLLLNTTLTVRAHQPASHQKKGWEVFTDNLITLLSKETENLVFILWGSPSIKKSSLIDESKHLVLTSPHPSPLSAYKGFFGNRHFSKTNTYLNQVGKTPINW